MKQIGKKKAFTIVELVIVIAVIAVLAAVLIPTFSNIVKKANLSNDQQNVRNMNTALAVEVIPNSKFATAGDAINGLYREGWNAGKLETYSNGFHYAYSLENNRMYLLDETDAVVYPEESVDKSTLWGFYRDAVEGTVDGITQYIAMTNITNGENLSQAFANNPVKIDLNGYYFGVAGDHTNITITNGALVKGAVTILPSDGTVEKFDVVSGDDIQTDVIYENKVFENINGASSYINMSNVTFKNCIFYNSSVRTNNTSGYIVFDGCTFNGGIDGSAAIEIYHDKNDFSSITIKNCTFNQPARAINITSNNTNSKTIMIEGCTFNGVYQEKQLIQVASNRYIDSITVKDNNFVSLGSGVAIFRFHGSYTGFNDISTLNNITFSNNTVSKSISEEKYVYLDDKFTPEEFYNAALAKFKSGLK